MKYLLMIALLLIVVTKVYGEEPFGTESYQDALMAAKKEQKIVLIDFYTTWCGPCKLLDKKTWQDEKVKSWLKEKTIALKVDAEKDRELAARFNINAYPTIVLVKPDGKELDRLVGYREAEQFLSEANDALAGKDSVARAKAELVGDKQNNPMERMKYAEALAQKGQNAEALKEYLWCFDNGLKFSRGFYGVRLSFLLTAISELGRRYPPASDALHERRETAEKDVLGGNYDRDKVIDMIRLNEFFGEPDRTLNIFDQLKDIAGANKAREVMLDKVINQLIAAHRYKDIVNSTKDINGRVEQLIRNYEETAKFLTAQPDRSDTNREADKKFVEELKKKVLLAGSFYYEALLGLKKEEDAEDISERLINFENSGETYQLLIEHARTAGANDVADKLKARGLSSLPDKEKAVLSHEDSKATKQ